MEQRPQAKNQDQDMAYKAHANVYDIGKMKSFVLVCEYLARWK